MSAVLHAPNRENDRAIRVYVTPVARGWDVHGEMDGRIMMTRHCDDWHRVERSCARLEAALRHLDAADDATSAVA
jgi:hypothetical protein